MTESPEYFEYTDEYYYEEEEYVTDRPIQVLQKVQLKKKVPVVPERRPATPAARRPTAPPTRPPTTTDAKTTTEKGKHFSCIWLGTVLIRWVYENVEVSCEEGFGFPKIELFWRTDFTLFGVPP